MSGLSAMGGVMFLLLAGCGVAPEEDSVEARRSSGEPLGEIDDRSGEGSLPLRSSPEADERPEVSAAVTGESGDLSRAESSLLQLASTENSRYLTDVADDLAHLDPRKDGWVGEVINEAVVRRLNTIKTALVGPSIDSKELESMLAETFQCQPLRPVSLSVAFESAGMVVRRPSVALESVSMRRQGLVGLVESLESLLGVEELGEEVAVEAYFKVVSVEADRSSSQTEVLVELVLISPSGRVQQNAVWECRWHPPKERGGLPLLAEIRVTEFDEVLRTGQGTPLFADRTSAVLGANDSYTEQLAYGVDYWRERIDWRFSQAITGPHGIAIGDVNGDGLDDLFVCETGGLPNRLFLQQRDGTLTDHSAAAGVDYLEPTSSALLVDLDNDGDQDLVFTSGRNLLFFENDGQARFERRWIHRSDSVARSMTAVDYDLDGLLDLYVCGYFSAEGDGSGIGRPLPYHDANNGVRNYLLKNLGQWAVEDVTEAVGLGANNRRFSYAAAWEDYDNDGDLDLYVANDFGRNNLYRNDGGQFRDVAAQAGVEDLSAGMSVSWGDYNRDGLPDLYVGNMYSSAGNRVAYQRQYRTGESEASRQQFQRHARGNSLFENTGEGTFKDVSLEAGVTMGRWAWGSNFGDLNNDGWEDLMVSNGLVSSPDDTGDL